MDKGPRYRDTVLPFSLQPTSGSLVTSTLAPAPELDETEEHGAESPSKAEDDTSSSLQPRLLRKKRKETVHPSQDVTDVKANPNVGPPNRTTKAATESEVWQKYRRFWESDQAGKGIVAHDNSIEHNIVVIKKFKMHASRSQHEQLLRVMGDKHPNIVRLQDVFVCDLSVYSVYESLESSLHHIQATCLQEITEIELAIIAKEVLQGIQYIHNELNIVYGQLCTRNVLLSFYDCSIKLANIADSILKPQRQSYSDDIHDIGTLLVSFKEPGTFRRNPKGLLLEKDDAKEKLGKDNMLIFQSMISSSNLPDQVG
ncbi:hypothetical protein Y699_09333 [Aspergillus fumigatus Z5]|nr:hypothetical protein Y699_09333 [Aspergillus fumigatus Z5]